MLSIESDCRTCSVSSFSFVPTHKPDELRYGAFFDSALADISGPSSGHRKEAGENDAPSVYNDLRHAWMEFLLRFVAVLRILLTRWRAWNMSVLTVLAGTPTSHCLRCVVFLMT
jgi:hypothetical protein